MFVLPQWKNIKHIFHKLDDDFISKMQYSEDRADEMSEILEGYYWKC